MSPPCHGRTLRWRHAFGLLHAPGGVHSARTASARPWCSLRVYGVNTGPIQAAATTRCASLPEKGGRVALPSSKVWAHALEVFCCFEEGDPVGSAAEK
jgi:hypothetical protein